MNAKASTCSELCTALIALACITAGWLVYDMESRISDIETALERQKVIAAGSYTVQREQPADQLLPTGGG